MLFHLLTWLHLLTGLLPNTAAAKPPVTTVYLVRHGEKDLTPNLADPALTPAGEARALALRDMLAGRHPAALFTTDTRRTRATLAPLAAAKQLTPQVYDAKDPAALAALIRRDYAGKTVVVVSHSNRLPGLIEALGAKPPMTEISEAEFSYLFEMQLPASGRARLKVRHYGAR
ncbi:histidine phosphatase family protein [Hymenobacter sp. ASUV-10]|uniref:Histidine phosphatase family protein n=1 Tax=Hymenobacter aranciens TaxID=3063996 RepID=A0ABT9B5K2_9BACT|nr:histidine phosphatase family protein [Hymenobacter sp. ASUV-10]MDO7873540.1 histidine phosphatase family protein [Hymenobacter sp. ASUV-10]